MTVIAEPENLDVVADGLKAFVQELLDSSVVLQRGNSLRKPRKSSLPECAW